ncbi:unnamed protein product [Brassica rapa subsp. narinosa]
MHISILLRKVVAPARSSGGVSDTPLLGASSEEFHYVISQRVSALVLPRQRASRSEWSMGVGLLVMEMACASLVLGGVIKSSMAVAASAFHLLCLYLLRSRCTSSALLMN